MIPLWLLYALAGVGLWFLVSIAVGFALIGIRQIRGDW